MAGKDAACAETPAAPAAASHGGPAPVERASAAPQEASRDLVQMAADLARSEARLRDFAECGSDWFYELDAELRFSYVGASAQPITGEDPQALLGRRPTLEGLLEVDAAAWAQHVADLEAARPIRDFRFARRGRDGRIRHLTVTAKPIADADGTFRGYRGCGTDITAQVETEAALRASDERFRDFADAAAHWVWETDRDFYFSFVSEGFERMTGIAPATVLGKRGTDISADDPERRSATEEIDRRMRRREHFMDVIVPRPMPDGRTMYQCVSGKPVFDRAGRFVGYRGLTRDITAQRVAELEALSLRTERDIAAGADRAKTQFLASMSHELRTPLNAIIGFSEFITLGMFGPLGDARYAGYAKHIHDSAHHLLAVINDLLDVSRIELGRYQIECVRAELADIMRECCAMVGPLAHAAGLSCAIDVGGADFAVYVDPRAIKQVLVNLLSNAIKFTPAGGRITVTARRGADGAVLVAVADTGVGISAQDLPGLFEAFVKGDARQARGGGGAGLGLWISRALARLHGGDLAIVSAENEGTTAILILPAERVVARAGGPMKSIA